MSFVRFENWHKQQNDRHHFAHKQDTVMIAVEEEWEVFVGSEVPEVRSVVGMPLTDCRSLDACWNWKVRCEPR